MTVTAHILVCMDCGHTFDGPATSDEVDATLKRPCPACGWGRLRVSGTRDDRVSWIVVRCLSCGEDTQIPHEQPHRVAQALKERCACGGTRMPADRR